MKRLKRICKKDVLFAMSILEEKAQFAKIKSDDLTHYDSDLEYGQYLAFKEAINVIKYVIL